VLTGTYEARPVRASAFLGHVAHLWPILGPRVARSNAGLRLVDALDDGGDGRAVVLELLGAIGDLDSGPPADVLVVGALVGILESAPPADVIDQDDLEVDIAGLDVVDQSL